MTYKIKDIIAEKTFEKQKVEEFFQFGLELGVFKVVGNEGSEIIYENNNPSQATTNSVLLNEQEKKVVPEQKPESEPSQSQEGSRPARVGNVVSSGFGNPFAGTSWGN
jgi:hypothetical protein